MIQVRGVSKQFKLYHSPADRLKEIVFRHPYHKDFTALDGISFEVRAGETLGIIGQNGAGKSTLLKILSGILLPDSGTVRIDGKVTGLLELGTGFNYELTGLGNINMNGTLLGMSKEEIERKKNQIIDFSELGDFINEPLKTYSSGMVMRLAFSIAIHADPRCFLIDEALAVGDAYFQQKCMRKMEEFRAGGGSMVIVSHDMNAVMTICDTVLFLENGRSIALGAPKSIIDLYISTICKKAHRGQREVFIDRTQSRDEEIHSNISTNEIEFLSIKISDRQENQKIHVFSEDEVFITFSFRSLRLVENPAMGILIRNRYGVSIFGTNTYLMKQKIDPFLPGNSYEVTFSMKMSLQPDDYLISIAVANGGHGMNEFSEYLLRLNDIATLKVIRNEHACLYEGIVDLQPRVSVANKG